MGGKLMDKSELESRNLEAMEEDHMEKLYNSKNPLIKYIHLGKLKKVIDLIPKKKNIKILDAGCGEGHLLFEVSKLIDSSNKLYGTDILDVALEKAKERVKGGSFSLQNLESLNFKNNSFDVIMCTDVIEHIPNYKKVLSELKRVLKEDGTLIISFPNETLWTISRFFLGRKPIKVPEHCNSFSPRDLINEVNLKVDKRFNIPFGLPHFLSLTRILVFKKEV